MADATNVVPPTSSKFPAVQPPPVSLPQRVEQLLNRICAERNQPQPDAEVRRKLALLGEDKALDLLTKIWNKTKEIKTLSGLIVYMIQNKPQYHYSSPSPSPSKSLSASRFQTQSDQHGGVRPPNFSASPSKAPRTSLPQGSSSAHPSMDPLPPPQEQHGVRPPNSSASPSKASRTSLCQGPSSARPSMDPLPPPQEQHGRVRPPCSTASPSKAARTSLCQGPSSARPSTNSLPPHQDDGQAQLFETRVREASGLNINKQDRQLIIESVMRYDQEDEIEDDSSTIKPVSRKEALKAVMTLNNFLLQYEKTTPELFTMLRKVGDEIQSDINFKKKQTMIDSYFRKTS